MIYCAEKLEMKRLRRSPALGRIRTLNHMITIRVLYHFTTTTALEIAVSARHAYLIFPFVKLLKEPDLGQDLLKAVVHQRVENFSQVLLLHFWI